MPNPYDYIPDDVKREAQEQSETPAPKKPKKQPSAQSAKTPIKTETASNGAVTEQAQRRLFKRKRAGVVLSREEVRTIKERRKQLRKELRARGIKTRQDFEYYAGSEGAYFDKRSSFWAWLWSHWLAGLIALLLLLMLLLYIFSLVQEMRGHFTINLSDDLFREGFVLSETVGFENPSTFLFSTPTDNVPCTSIADIPNDVQSVDGKYDASNFFAYTYYIRNDGESPVSVKWSLLTNSESQNLSDAAWVALYVDGKLSIYAKSHEDGTPEMIPAEGVNRRGYINIPLMSSAPECDQFKVIAQKGQISYYRVVPIAFEADTVVTSGTLSNVQPMEVHKYTVILYLEGDDPECTDDKIGGNLGVEMNFAMSDIIDEEEGVYADSESGSAVKNETEQSLFSSLREYIKNFFNSVPGKK